MDIKMNLKDAVFLLGGHDLEMLEISKMLSSKGIRFYDENLKWDNAHLSKYSNRLNDTDFFVGIELITDIKTPTHYLLIDHHNENAEKPSAIKQVAELFDITLTHYQLLVAANDKGYIPALEAMGATKDEIEYIRKRDRKAQGVTNEDELLGEKSIIENLTIKNGITVVKSLTSKFSTITDRLYTCNKLLIYTDDELNYFGEGISSLTLAYDNLIKQQKAYSGGGEKGFFGLNSEGIIVLGHSRIAVQKIINLLTNGKYIN